MADVVVTNTSAGLTGKKLATVQQVVYSQDSAVATGTTTIPVDDTIPQNTEGTQFLSVSITPASASSKLRIDACLVVASNTGVRTVVVALFQDSTASALKAVTAPVPAALVDFMQPVNLTHFMTSGTTSATTFKIRAGVETSGTVTVNGAGGGRAYGGVCGSFISVTEIEA